MNETRHRTGTVVAALLFAVAALLALPGVSYAVDEVELTDDQIARMLVTTSSFDDCDFVMRDYSANKTTYLKYRDEYRALLAVGEPDGLVPNEDEPEPLTELEQNPLEQVAYPRANPWCNVLWLQAGMLASTKENNGTAFMVSDKIALTAAHCLFRAGALLDYVEVQSGVVSSATDNGWAHVVKAVVPKEGYGRSDNEGDITDSSYDWALLVLDRSPAGTSASGYFSCETLFPLQHFDLALCNAGYSQTKVAIGGSADPSKPVLWKSENSVGVMAGYPIGSNNAGTFQIRLSMIAGMSGGPIYQYQLGKYIAVGINAFENKNPLYGNYGCAISDTVLHIIEWAQANGYNHIAPGWDVDDKPSSPSTGVDEFVGYMALTQIEEQKTIQGTKRDSMSDALHDAHSANADVRAWLYVPGTGVSLPIAQRFGDDAFYLTHDQKGSPSLMGCAFAEGGDSLQFEQPITVLYAHTFSTPGAEVMFTGLHHLSYEQVFDAFDEFVIQTYDGRLLTYKIIEAAPYRADHISSYVNEDEVSSVQEYFNAFGGEPQPGFSGYRRSTELQGEEDKIVQLSTCLLKGRWATSEDGRWVVTGVLVESEQVDG